MSVFVTGAGKPPIIGDENTLLLLHGTEIKDSSIYQVPLINIGAEISNSQTKFGNGSYYFNGSARIDIPTPFSFDFSTGNFTVDYWAYQTQSLSGGVPFIFAGDPDLFTVYIVGGNLTLFFGTQFFLVTLTSEKLNQWIHYALVKNGSSIKFFENGIQTYTASTDIAIPNPIDYIRSIGGRNDQSQYFKGYIEEFRVSNIARWTQNFTPPIEPY